MKQFLKELIIDEVITILLTFGTLVGWGFIYIIIDKLKGR